MTDGMLREKGKRPYGILAEYNVAAYIPTAESNASQTS